MTVPVVFPFPVPAVIVVTYGFCGIAGPGDSDWVIAVAMVG
jgi:hypothetical protein